MMMTVHLRTPDIAATAPSWRGGWVCPQAPALLVPTRDDLHRGVKNEEFFVQYQPKISMATGELVGAEALMRWKHQRFWAISPEKVIRLAEDCGLVHELGMQMIAHACNQLERWMLGGRKAIQVAVNVSTKQLSQEGFSSTVIGMLLSQRIPPHLLMIEITESAELERADACVSAIAHLKAVGVGVSLDDFGTGFSSMSYLKMFQVDEIKIDRSFVTEILSNEKDQAIVEAILLLGKSLGLSVVAEGIESWAQQRCLMRMGCKVGQGYLYGKPMAADKLESGFPKFAKNAASTIAADRLFG